MKTTEIHSKLKDIHQEIKELIMAGKLDEDFPAFMDMWEEMAEIDMLLTDWDGDSKYVQRRLINAEMARIDEEDNV